MPNVRGFGPLIAMLFAPIIELKRDHTNSRYTSIISGLGFDASKDHAIFEEHDCLFDLDAEFTQTDFDQVNQIRYCFDTLLFTYEGQEENKNISRENKATILTKIRDLIAE